MPRLSGVPSLTPDPNILQFYIRIPLVDHESSMAYSSEVEGVEQTYQATPLFYQQLGMSSSKIILEEEADCLKISQESSAPKPQLTTRQWKGRYEAAWSRPDILKIPRVRRGNKEVTLQLENCQCPKCIHPDTKQRASDTFAIPLKVKANSVEHKETGLEISWSDNHTGFYPYEWLHPHTQNKHGDRLEQNRLKPARNTAPGPRTFNPVPASDQSPRISYDEVMSDDKRLSVWLQLIWTRGFCFVDGVPTTPEATKGLIERIAFIRHTHYGGFWDFTADLTFKDTAYTNEFLGAHTDNTYFTDPARLQLFHLLSHTDGSGGENLLVDGFAAAAQLRSENPTHYDELVRHRHPWHASGNDDSCIQPSAQAPVFSVHPDLDKMYQIRWNDYDRAPKVNWSAEEQLAWYRAARHYNEILQSREMWQKLEPGSALSESCFHVSVVSTNICQVFDNWRMLHGRSQFTGKRRMCGGYINNDDYISRLRMLKYGRECVLNNLGNVRNVSTNPYSIV
ncbi:unnamed protein product [Penicillium salamii]|nr:unnamed protein product [Penicillium salamii]